MGDSYKELSVLSGSQRKQHDFSFHLRQDENVTDSPFNRTSMLPAKEFDPLGRHTLWQVIIIVFFCGSLSLVTVVGNILVFVSFKINKALKTVNNYYLLSLAFADLTIGILSMNLYTTYIVMDQWALGPVVCDLWLAVDYVASNASVMNLLVISFDRYFSVTRPLSYRAKRTTKRAMTMIGLAWSISIILWAPAILFWQYIVGERTVQPNECYIQFLSEPIITFCTAIAAFYLPVTIMAILFWKIYQETKKRAKDVQSLKGSGSCTNPTQAQNQESGSGRKSGKGAATSPNQRNSTAMLRQISSQSCSSYELCDKVGACGNQAGSEAEHDVAEPSKLPQGMTMKDTALAKHWSRNEKKSNEKKAAQTLSAILFAFIMTWLPYNIMVLVNTFCQDCIPETLWALGYWLCYVNSTVNPMCYALCNKTFRTTFRDILMCQWNQRKNKPHFHQRHSLALQKKGNL
ncbi:muscarinic acetylcholine receptor M3 [Xenentodon cancila]